MADTTFSVELEWDDGSGVRAKELQATWCRLVLKVGDQPVTLLRDLQAGSFRKSIHVSSYPLAEWFAYNWWTLQAASPPMLAESFVLNVAAVGDGFPWPHMELSPDEESVVVRWNRSTHDRIEFVGRGLERVTSESVLHTATAVIENTLSRLDDAGVPRTPLHEEWAAINAADDEERAFAAAAARLGADPYDMPDELALALVSASDELPPDLHQDVLAAASPANFQGIAAWITDQIPSSGAARRHLPTDSYHEWANAIRSNGGSRPSRQVPWARGFAAAQVLRKFINPVLAEPVDLDDVILTEQRRFPHRAIEAVCNRTDAVRIVVPEGRQTSGLRFCQARALYRALTIDPNHPFALTNARTGVQKAERAFAAELLAPVQGIRELARSDFDALTDDDADDLAHAFGVSSLVIRHQIDNHARTATV